ncbi:putative protein isoform X2 [Capsicum annuum]|uniref:uncharacterized protein LOC107841305 isoform X2 n=1 Tax=Capsicum annuum TaxID=4072 RepID=UPI0007BF226D|nr:uncharacterized protein LOC107841305 isoform X2 [Capsicum annuum]
MVIVIAQGVGQELLATDNSHARSEQDSSGNELPQDVGLWVSHKIRNMWDLTPDTDLLKELPEEYTFETPLADLNDNSLQAVWSKHADQRRLIRSKFYVRSSHDENAVFVIKQTIEELIAKCKEIVESEGERINEDEDVNDRDPSILRFLLSIHEEFGQDFNSFIT